MSGQELSKLMILGICLLVMIWAVFMFIDLVFCKKRLKNLFSIRKVVIALIISEIIALVLIDRALFAFAGIIITFILVISEGILRVIK